MSELWVLRDQCPHAHTSAHTPTDYVVVLKKTDAHYKIQISYHHPDITNINILIPSIKKLVWKHISMLCNLLSKKFRMRYIILYITLIYSIIYNYI